MAKTKGKNKNQDIKTAAKVAKKVAPTKGQVKKAAKKSGAYRAVPYLLIAFALILAVCFVTVRMFETDDGAGILGYYIQLVLCGLIGGGAFLLPLVLGYLGVLWCVLHFKESAPKRRSADGDNNSDSGYLRRRTIIKTTLSCVFVLLFSILMGVFSGADSADLIELWEDGGDSFVAGGIIGGLIAYLLDYAFSAVISSIILILGMLVTAFFAVGLTPDYVINKIRCRREIRRDEVELDDDDRVAAQYEKMRQREIEKAKKRKQKELYARQRAQIRQELHDADEDEEPVLVAPAPAPQRKAQKVAPVPDTEELLDGIGEDEGEIFAEPESEPLVLDNDSSEMAAEYGGDPILDSTPPELGGTTISVEDLLRDIPAAPVQTEQAVPEEITLGEISSADLSEDLMNVAPEEADDIEEEIVTPYIFPSVDMLAVNKNPTDNDVSAELQENARILKETLKSFKVDIREINYSRGPTITRYELRPEVGTRVRAIANLVDDIALSLATSGVRIEAPIPNKPAVGIEVPNRNRATVYLRDLIENSKFTDSKSKITACLGMDVGGNPVYFDVAKMPHLLIAGTTGSGKSVCINTVILSILYKARPDEVKLILIDPKQVEFTMYENIPHLYCPIVSEPKKAAGALASAVSEMERRFELIKSVGVRNIEGYNEITANDPSKEYMPKMVIIIDELADLMMTARDEVETSICRLAQKARAAGIHVILGTQRPSVDVITGLIKANVPSRIACTVTSQVDSRTIIDTAGAENLIGYGDMLFAPVGAAKPMRVQGAFVSDGEIENIVTFIKENNSSVKYNTEFINSMEENAKLMSAGKKGAAAAAEAEGDDGEDLDPKFNDAVLLAIQEGKIATSLLQRKLGVGYGRAAKIIDSMEARGYVSGAEGTKPRRVLITMQQYMDRTSDGTLGDISVGE